MRIMARRCKHCGAYHGKHDAPIGYCSQGCRDLHVRIQGLRQSLMSKQKKRIEEKKEKKRESRRRFRARRAETKERIRANRHRAKKDPVLAAFGCIDTYWPNDGFYSSREWAELRYSVLKTYGRKCMLCGAEDVQINVDHIKPRKLYPHLQLEFTNCQVLCASCNKGKGNWDETDWRSSANDGKTNNDTRNLN